MKEVYFVFLICVIATLGCNNSIHNELFNSRNTNLLLESNKQFTSNSKVEASKNSAGEIFWSGISGGVSIRWTKTGLFSDSTTSNNLLSQIAEQRFNAFQSGEKEENESNDNCEYYNEFKLLSVVGSLISFEDQISYSCGTSRAAGSTRITTIDLKKSENINYIVDEDPSNLDVNLSNLGKVVSLTDYFSEEDILQALLADSTIKNAIIALKNKSVPKKLEQIPELFASQNYQLADSDFELRPDFLTRFSFYDVRNDKVIITLSLPSHFGFNTFEQKQITLVLPKSENLRQQLDAAKNKQEGFLAINSLQISKKSITFEFQTNKDDKNSKSFDADNTKPKINRDSPPLIKRNFQKIAFETNKSNIDLVGKVEPGTFNYYTFAAKAGQKITAQITSDDSAAVFSIKPEKGSSYPDYISGATGWTGILKTTGNYEIYVGSGKTQNYLINIDIK